MAIELTLLEAEHIIIADRWYRADGMGSPYDSEEIKQAHKKIEEEMLKVAGKEG